MSAMIGVVILLLAPAVAWPRLARFLLAVGIIAGALAFAVPVTAQSTDVGSGEAPTEATSVEQLAESEQPEPDVAAGVRDSVVRLYGAVFGRAPDAAGLNYWVARYVSGTPLATVGRSFMGAPEWTATYGDVDDLAFIDLLYRNVLGRVPDPGGRTYWSGQLSSGMTRVQLLLGFSESPEYVIATGTAPPLAPPQLFPQLPGGSGIGRRVVYSNSEQRVWWVDEHEIVVKSYPVSGRKGVPDPGTYSVYSKSPVAWAGHDGITMHHMVRFAHGRSLAIGFHSIPRYPNGTPLQTEDELGGYRSAGCVRQADADAAALYEWVAIGTTVVVLP